MVALFAIARKRRELLRRIRSGDGDPRALKRSLAHLDAAAKLLSEPRQKRPRSRKPITWPIRRALEARALTSRELTPIICAVRGDNASDRATFEAIRRRIEDALYEMKRRGEVTAAGRPARWRLC